MPKPLDSGRLAEALSRLAQLRSEVTTGREKARSSGWKLAERATTLRNGKPKRPATVIQSGPRPNSAI